MFSNLAFIPLDVHYMLWVFAPILVISLLAQWWVKSAYARWSSVVNRQGITGREAAVVILRSAGIHDVRVEEVDGFLSDHYDPGEGLRLSPENYRGTSIAAVGIAAHEAGHAIQHAQQYAPLALRSLAVPMANIGNNFGYIAIVIGLFMTGTPYNFITILGLLGLAAVALFQLVNLPVEFDASRRALVHLPDIGILDAEENHGARRVLRAAAFTYVAGTIAAVWTLLYWLMRLGFLGGSRDE